MLIFATISRLGTTSGLLCQLVYLGRSCIVGIGVRLLLQDAVRWRWTCQGDHPRVCARQGPGPSVPSDELSATRPNRSCGRTAQRTPGLGGMLATPIVAMLIMMLMMLVLVIVITANHLDFFITLRRLAESRNHSVYATAQAKAHHHEGMGRHNSISAWLFCAAACCFSCLALPSVPVQYDGRS